MLIVRSPLRLSLFGGSTDYESYYRDKGAFLIGVTINKHVYLSMRYRAKILGDQSIITYSRSDIVKDWDEIHNPLIRESLKFKQLIHPIDFNSFSDIPSRTGLGGSSSFCVGLLYLINILQNTPQSKKDLIRDAIHVERHILNEAGGIQDQVWPVYGGLNTMEIFQNGDFKVKPLGVTEEFMTEFQNSMLLIYTNSQRQQEEIAQSHETKWQYKSNIETIARNAHSFFINEDIRQIGRLLKFSWEAKREISRLITTPLIDEIVNLSMDMGAYGAKLLGSGGCGFVLVICDPKVREKLKDVFRDQIMDFQLTTQGVTEIFST